MKRAKATGAVASRHVTRRDYIAATGAFIGGLAGCLGSPGASVGSAGSGGEVTSGEPTSAPAPEGGPPTSADVLPLPIQPASLSEQSVSGGPPKDGIPAIDAPAFVPAGDVGDDLEPGDPVFGVRGGTEVKAYPQRILVYHEICNDVLDSRPVSVTYCPLTGTAMGFDRGETTFGVSGRLINNNLIMYDRATETWWPQVLSTSIPGPWNEDPPLRSLLGFRVTWTTWGQWRDRYPDTLVLSRDTGHARNYDADPYGAYNPRSGYYAPGSPAMFRSFSEDDRFEPKEVVVGARATDGAVAFHKGSLRTAGILEGDLGGTRALAVHEPTLDTGYVYRNPEGLAFEHRDGSVVGPDGEAHAPEALPLSRVLALDAMWFAWDGFYPESSVHA